ncbi:MAG: recombinase family protein [Acetobacteraceae bacterium]|nr:recombinase family protein [Acetobacteraceae bacterium]
MNAHPRAFVPYLRVSTDRQGRSGLGLEAQQAAIDAFLRPGDRLLSPSFVEIESGRSTTRPKLRAALERCRKTGATLLVAKVDRLSRNLPFLRSLIDGSVDVAFCDLPHIPPGAAGRFLLSQMALVAEFERDMISERTKAALAAAKARGVKLGGDRGYRPANPPNAKTGSAAAAEARSRAASQSAFRLLPVIEEARAAGATSLHAIAAYLTRKGVPTPRGGAWTATAVRRVLMRMEMVDGQRECAV